MRLHLVGLVACLAVAACSSGPSPSQSRSPSPAPTPQLATPSPSPEATPSQLVSGHYEGGGVSFDYPIEWRGATFDMTSNFHSLIVYLSTSPLKDPCERTANSISCGRGAVSGLDPNGILVEWSRSAWIGWTFDPTKGQLMSVGDRPATFEQLDPSEQCAAIGGVREILVTIGDVPPNQNWTEMRACLRGPSLDETQAQIETMLETVAWRQ